MEKMEDRFNEEISRLSFTYLELMGFTARPSLLVKIGMAMGYRMAVEDIAATLPDQEEKNARK